ncbi:MAG: NfeD family protein [Microbacteriaceae bacterium]
MNPDFLTAHAWMFWVVLILIFIIIEVATVDFTFLMIATGSAAGMVSGVFGLEWWMQVIVAAILSLLLLFAVRPPLLRLLKKGGDPALSNVAALLGSSGTALTGFADGTGQVKLANGETWTARTTRTATEAIGPGDRVIVTGIDGATALIALAERTTP